uniref:FHA domain-containing protein n=1 Tax=Cannabis sativa TaxID=3483 RepID=A0A803PG12_CANSA
MEEELEIEYGKLVGDNFEYRIFTSSIILGRNKSSKRYKKVKVDVDLCSLGGIKDLISGHHARIFYDFYRCCFAIEVLGRCGCYIDGVLHLPGDPPVKLQPNNLVKIGGIEFYLVPTLLFGYIFTSFLSLKN